MYLKLEKALLIPLIKTPLKHYQIAINLFSEEIKFIANFSYKQERSQQPKNSTQKCRLENTRFHPRCHINWERTNSK